MILFNKYSKYLCVPILLTALLESGCSNIVLMNPKGQIGLEQRSLILTALGLMLIIIIPVIVMTFIFAIKYNESNKSSIYRPNWCKSTKIEIVVWTIPILIVIFLTKLTWKSTHLLDPGCSINSDAKPINIQVISMDWKWLFIYPKLDIATINEIVFPVNVPIKFKISSNSVMNSFFIPQLGSQIYAMAGMSATLHLIANEPGKYKGISANFSGRGFSGMKFRAIAMRDKASFNAWIYKVKKSSKTLNTIKAYEQLAKPSEYNSVEYFSNIKPNLFENVINKFSKHKK